MKRPTIGVDIIGGDQAPLLIFRDVIRRLETYRSPLKLCFFVLTTQLKELELHLQGIPSHVEIELVPCPSFIEMDEDPLIAVRKKKEATLLQALEAANRKEIEAVITLGNTGALVAATHLFSSKISGVDRTALLAKLPTKSGHIALIDVGANVASTSDQMMQFANMGIAYLQALGKKHLKLGLVNIGEEKSKGRHDLKNLYTQLTTKYAKNPNIAFVGNVEAYTIFSGEIDLLLTDGFTGNIILKTAEGISSFIFEHLISDISSDVQQTMQKKFGNFIGHKEHPGALLLGVETIVMKCHGRSEGKQIYKSIEECAKLLESDLLMRMVTNLREM